jgi:hypothetical protein
MKTISLVAVMLMMFPVCVNAQWKTFKSGLVNHTYLLEAGNVGLGTAPDVAPTEKLHVVGNTLSTSFISASGSYASQGSANLTLNANGIARLTVLSNTGFVGIGINPLEMLHVNGNVRSNQYSATSGLFKSESGDLTFSTSTAERLKIIAATGFVGIGTPSPSEMLHVNGNLLSNQYTAVYGTFNSPSNLTLSTGGTSRLNIIHATGFVGIGVTPTEMLHVNGNILTSGNITGNALSTTNATIGTFTANGGTVSSFRTGGITVSSDANYATASSNDLLVQGRVGIGTTLTSNPNNYVLAVNGKIGAKDVQVETKSTTWPDFVFASGYTLPNLYAVEQFIRANHHLQNVPSAQEIEKEHNLGQMDAILLQKVEELTLYIIQQQKEIDALKQKLAEKK